MLNQSLRFMHSSIFNGTKALGGFVSGLIHHFAGHGHGQAVHYTDQTLSHYLKSLEKSFESFETMPTGDPSQMAQKIIFQSMCNSIRQFLK